MDKRETKKAEADLFVKNMTKEAQDMSNKDLRAALWRVRDEINAKPTKQNPRNEQCTMLDFEEEQLFLLEEIYSKELKDRELLEWALRTK